MKKSKNRIFFILLGIFFILSAIALISADTGPHPSATVYFQVTYNNSSIEENFTASILACGRECDADNPNNLCIDGCESDNYALCSDGVCEFYYYRIERVPSKMKLLIELNGENLTSDIINFSWINPVLYYSLNINPDNKIIITPSNPFPTPKLTNSNASLLISLILALALTIIIELIVLIIFLRKWEIKTEKWTKFIITVIVADLISLPIVWIIFFFLLVMFSMIFLWTGVFLAILIAEAFAVIFEAYFIYWLNKKVITLKKSFILSIVMNIASFIIGGIILTILLSQLY